MNYEGMPEWESDFWSVLMEDQGVKVKGGPDPFFYAANPEAEYVSPYATADMLVGEIVEDEHVQLPEIGA